MASKFQMNYYLVDVLTGLLLGVLCCFLVTALSWSFENASQSRFGVRGEATILTVNWADNTKDVETAQEGLGSIQSFANDQDISLIFSSSGEGRPEIVVVNPTDAVPWADPNWETSDPSRIVIHPFGRSNYDKAVTMALAPSGSQLADPIQPEPWAEGLQYARSMGSIAPPPGILVVTSLDPGVTTTLQELLASQNLTITGIANSQGWLSVLQDPIVVISITLVFGGAISIGISSRLRQGTLLFKLEVSREYGALAIQAWTRTLFSSVLRQSIGAFLGTLSFGLITWTVSQIHPDGDIRLLLVGGMIMTILICIILGAITTTLIVRDAWRLEC